MKKTMLIVAVAIAGLPALAQEAAKSKTETQTDKNGVVTRRKETQTEKKAIVGDKKIITDKKEVDVNSTAVKGGKKSKPKKVITTDRTSATVDRTETKATPAEIKAAKKK